MNTDGVDFFVAKGDLGPGLQRQLGDDDGSNFTLGGVSSCTFRMVNRETGAVIVDDAVAQIVDPNLRLVKYDWTQGDTDIEGVYYGVFRIVFADARRVTFPNDEPLVIEVGARP